MFDLTLFLNFLRGDVFNAFVKVIPNFYSCKANVEFTMVCFDGVDVIGLPLTRASPLAINVSTEVQSA